MSVEQVWSSAHKEEDVKERSWAMSDAHRFMDTNTALVIHSIAMPHDRNDIGMDEGEHIVDVACTYNNTIIVCDRFGY